MSQEFYSILTNKGEELQAQATAGNPVDCTHMVFGSGLNNNYYNPSKAQTALKSQVHSEVLSDFGVHPDNSKWILFEAQIPATIGDFTIREIGLKDENGNLVAIGRFPETYKPVMEQGSTKDLVIRIVLQVGSPENFTAIIDPNVIMATRAWTMEQLSPLLINHIESTSNIQLEQLRQAEKLKELTEEY